jgi:hypothetical protein
VQQQGSYSRSAYINRDCAAYRNIHRIVSAIPASKTVSNASPTSSRTSSNRIFPASSRVAGPTQGTMTAFRTIMTLLAVCCLLALSVEATCPKWKQSCPGQCALSRFISEGKEVTICDCRGHGGYGRRYSLCEPPCRKTCPGVCAISIDENKVTKCACDSGTFTVCK